MKKFLLVDKTTGKPVYGGQVFEGAQADGLVGGPLQTSAYWVDVTALTDNQITTNKTKTFTPNTPPAASASNAVVLTADGAWA